MTVTYAILAFAILFEVIALTALKETQGFTRLLPALVFGLGLAASFYLESLALKVLPIGLTYAVWAGAGIVCMGVVGALLYGERLNPGVVLGMLLIVAGIAVMHQFTPQASETVSSPVSPLSQG